MFSLLNEPPFKHRNIKSSMPKYVSVCELAVQSGRTVGIDTYIIHIK